MRILANANFKGGTGKTLTAVNLAALLAREGKRTLLIDADPQHNATSFFLGYHDELRDRATLSDVLAGTGEAVWEDNLTETPYARLFLLPADMGLLRLDLSAILNQSTAPLRRMADFIDAAEGDGNLDYILFDCPPSFTAASVAALSNADEVILPTTPDAFSRAGMYELIDQAKSLGQATTALRFRVLLTMTDRTTAARQVEEMLRNSGLEMFKATIRRGVAAVESSYARKPLYEYAPKSGPARDYEALVKEVLGDA